MKSALVIDIETHIDKHLVNTTRYPTLGLTDDTAYQRYQAELTAERGSDFLPVVYHRPISIAVGHVKAQYQLTNVMTLGQQVAAGGPDAERLMVEEFWELVNEGHTLVTYNGRGFDMPVLELAALRYGIQAPRYWGTGGKSARYRYSDEQHYDVADVLCNTGAVPRMPLNDLLIMLGFSGKGEVDGSKVQQMWEDGKFEDIHAYCRRDVAQTWLLWLRVELIRGRLTHSQYDEAF